MVFACDCLQTADGRVIVLASWLQHRSLRDYRPVFSIVQLILQLIALVWWREFWRTHIFICDSVVCLFFYAGVAKFARTPNIRSVPFWGLPYY